MTTNTFWIAKECREGRDHWSTTTTNFCQDCKEDDTLQKDLSRINWHDLNNIAPADVVCHF